MTGLRLDEGIDLDELARITDLDPATRYQEVIASLQEEGLVHYHNGRLSLTPAGLPISDAVFLRFF